MPGVGDFVFCNLPDLIRQQRDHRDGLAGERHKFHRAAFAAFVNKHDRANVARAQAVLRQVGRQHHAVEFLRDFPVWHNRSFNIGRFHFLRLRLCVENLCPDLRAFAMRAQSFDFGEFFYRLQRLFERGAGVFHHAGPALELVRSQPGK